MTQNEFIKVNKSGKTPMFKELIGLRESGKTSELIDFCTMAHPKALVREAQRSKYTVFLNNDKVYHYTIYTDRIVRTCGETQARKMFLLQ